MKSIIQLLLFLAFASCVSLDTDSMGKFDSTGLSRHNVNASLSISSRIDDSLPRESMDVDSFAMTPEDLEEALQSAIQKTGFFSSVADKSDWTLKVVLRRSALMQGSESTMAREAQLICDWSLLRSGTAKPVWQERISTRDRKTFGDVFAGDKRTARAVEGAARKNIQTAFLAMENSGALPKGTH